jgi:hypothetical protein
MGGQEADVTSGRVELSIQRKGGKENREESEELRMQA